MSKWLDRLREHEKNRHTPPNQTDKTPKTPSEAVLGVLSVPHGAICANFSETKRADELARFDERAAILEYDAGLSREEAERLARIEARTTLH